MKDYLVAGLLSGGAGLLVFLVIHHLWIKPIWFILPAGLVIAGLGGLSAGWAYAVLLPHLPPRPWTALAVFLLVMVILGPAILLSAFRPALFDMLTGQLLPQVTVSTAVRRFVVELLVPSVLTGALSGWLIGRTGQAALVTALAGLVFALGPGHNIPLLAGTPGVAKGTAILLASTLVSSLVLVEADAWL